MYSSDFERRLIYIRMSLGIVINSSKNKKLVNKSLSRAEIFLVNEYCRQMVRFIWSLQTLSLIPSYLRQDVLVALML